MKLYKEKYAGGNTGSKPRPQGQGKQAQQVKPQTTQKSAPAMQGKPPVPQTPAKQQKGVKGGEKRGLLAKLKSLFHK
jgi:hypothetical protein